MSWWASRARGRTERAGRVPGNSARMPWAARSLSRPCTGCGGSSKTRTVSARPASPGRRRRRGWGLVVAEPFVGGHVQGAVAQVAQQFGHRVRGVDPQGHGQQVAQRARQPGRAVQRDAPARHGHREGDRGRSSGAGRAVDQHRPDGLQHTALRDAPGAGPAGEANGFRRVQAQPGAAHSAAAGGAGGAARPGGGGAGGGPARPQGPGRARVLGGDPGGVVAQVGPAFAAGQGAAGEVGTVEGAQQEVGAPGVEQGAVVGEHDPGGRGGAGRRCGVPFQQGQAQRAGAAQVEAAQPVLLQEHGPAAGGGGAAGDVRGDPAVHDQLRRLRRGERRAQDRLAVEHRLPGGTEAVGVEGPVPDPHELLDMPARTGTCVAPAHRAACCAVGANAAGIGAVAASASSSSTSLRWEARTVAERTVAGRAVAGRAAGPPVPGGRESRRVPDAGCGRARRSAGGPAGEEVEGEVQPAGGDLRLGLEAVGAVVRQAGHPVGRGGRCPVRAVQDQTGRSGRQAAQSGAQQRVGAELPAGPEPGTARGPAGAGGQEARRGGQLAQGVGGGIQGELDRVHIGEPADVAAQTRMSAPGITADVEPDLVGTLPTRQGQREHPGQHLLLSERQPPGQPPDDPLGPLLVQSEDGLPDRAGGLGRPGSRRCRGRLRNEVRGGGREVFRGGRAGAGTGCGGGRAGAGTGSGDGRAGAGTGSGDGRAGAGTGSGDGRAGAGTGSGDGRAGAGTGSGDGRAGAGTGSGDGRAGAGTGSGDGRAGAGTGSGGGQRGLSGPVPGAGCGAAASHPVPGAPALVPGPVSAAVPGTGGRAAGSGPAVPALWEAVAGAESPAASGPAPAAGPGAGGGAVWEGAEAPAPSPDGPARRRRLPGGTCARRPASSAGPRRDRRPARADRRPSRPGRRRRTAPAPRRGSRPGRGQRPGQVP